MQRKDLLKNELAKLVENLPAEEQRDIKSKLEELVDICSDQTSEKGVDNLIQARVKEAKVEHQPIYAAAADLLKNYVRAIRPPVSDTSASSSTSLLTREFSSRNLGPVPSGANLGRTSSQSREDAKEEKITFTLDNLVRLSGISKDSEPNKYFYEKMAGLILADQPKDAPVIDSSKIAKPLQEKVEAYNVKIEQINMKYPRLRLNIASAEMVFNAVQPLIPKTPSVANADQPKKTPALDLNALLNRIKILDLDLVPQLPQLPYHSRMPDVNALTKFGKSSADKILDNLNGPEASKLKVQTLLATVNALKKSSSSTETDDFQKLLKDLCKLYRNSENDSPEKLFAAKYINEIYRDICLKEGKEFTGGAYNVLYALARQDHAPSPTTPTTPTTPSIKSKR